MTFIYLTWLNVFSYRTGSHVKLINLTHRKRNDQWLVTKNSNTKLRPMMFVASVRWTETQPLLVDPKGRFSSPVTKQNIVKSNTRVWFGHFSAQFCFRPTFFAKLGVLCGDMNKRIFDLVQKWAVMYIYFMDCFLE